MFRQCHTEETDLYGNPIEKSECPKRSTEEEQKQEEEEHMGMQPNGSRQTRAVNTRWNKNNEPMADQVEEYLEDVKRKWVMSQRAWGEFGVEKNPTEKEKKRKE